MTWRGLDLRRKPLFPLTLALLAGLSLAWMVQGLCAWIWIPAAAALLCAAAAYFLRPARLLLGCLCALFLGCSLLWGSLPSWWMDDAHVGELLQFSGRVCEVQVTGRSTRLLVEDVCMGEDRSSLAPVEGHLQLSLAATDRSFAPGDRLMFEARPRLPAAKTWRGDTDESAMALRDGVRWLAEVPDAELYRVGHEDLPGFRGFLQGLRGNIAAAIDGAFSPDSAAFVRALTLGTTQGMRYETRDQFARLGLSHVLAISGLHVSLLFEIMDRLRRRMGSWQHLGKLLSWGLLLLYLLIADFRLSLLRVVFMQLVRVLAERSCRRYDGIGALCAAFLLQTLLQPGAFLDMGLQMSYLSTLALLLFSKALEAMEKSRWKFLAPAGMTAVVMFVTWPYMLYHFGELAPASFLGNLIFVPLMPFVLLGCVCWMLTLLLCPMGFAPVTMALEWIVSSYLSGVTIFGSGAELWILGIDRIFWIFPYAVGILWLAPALGSAPKMEKFLALGLCLLAAIGLLYPREPEKGAFVFSQGEACALVCVQEGETCLIAGKAMQDIPGILKEQRIRELDRAILCGDEQDAAAILKDLGDYPMGRIEWAGMDHENGKIPVRILQHIAGEDPVLEILLGDQILEYHGDAVRLQRPDGTTLTAQAAPYGTQAEIDLTAQGLVWIIQE